MCAYLEDLKESVKEHHPELEILISEDVMINRYMMKTVQEDQTALKYELVEKLVVSMKKQIKTLLKSESQHTKY